MADSGLLANKGVLPDVESLRIPVQYLANLLTAGDTEPVLLALKRMLAMRHFKRAETVENQCDTSALEQVGLTQAQAQEMYRYLAIANYEDRFVIPSSHRELAREAFLKRKLVALVLVMVAMAAIAKRIYLIAGALTPLISHQKIIRRKHYDDTKSDFSVIGIPFGSALVTS